MLIFKNISVTLNHKNVVHHASGEIKTPTLVGLMGLNGSGKTTLLKALAGLIPCSGDIFFNTLPITTIKTDLPLKRSYLPAERTCAWNLKVEEILTMKAPLNENAYDLLDAFAMHSHLQTPIHHLSTGEKARVFLIYTLHTSATFFFLDEALLNLDPKYQLILFEILHQKKQRGCSIILTLHDMHLAHKLCDVLWVMQEGTLVYQAPPHSVIPHAAYPSYFQMTREEMEIFLSGRSG